MPPSMIRIEIARDTAGSPRTPYLLAPTCVTYDELDEFARSTGTRPIRDAGWGRGTLPAVSLELSMMLQYCNWRSRLDDLCPCYDITNIEHDDPDGEPWIESKVRFVIDEGGYRLPAPEEWLWAARGGVSSRGTRYAGGNDLDEVAWHGGNAERRAHPVGQKAPNELGLHDMTGNVLEACAATVDPIVVVGQGGAWPESYAAFLELGRSYGAYTRSNFFGFRVCRTDQ